MIYNQIVILYFYRRGIFLLNITVTQVAFAPVKRFSRLMLDNELSQHVDGERQVEKYNDNQ